MTFLDIYSEHFVSLTIIFLAGSVAMVTFIALIFHRIFSNNKVKTPWFEIAPDSVKIPESEDCGKTRLLLKRQSDYLEHFLGGIQPVFLAVEKEVITDAMKDDTASEHITTFLISTSANELMEKIKNYINNLLMINHIGSDRDKILKYSKGHVAPLIGIMRKSFCDAYCHLSDKVCLDTIVYWKNIGINDPSEWMCEQLEKLFLDLSDLRYSDFDKNGNNS